jgi:hypothetical protein
MTRASASKIGTVAESLIAPFYLKNVGRPAFFPTPGSKDFFDISHGFGNTALYAAFLAANHPTLTPSEGSLPGTEKNVR